MYVHVSFKIEQIIVIEHFAFIMTPGSGSRSTKIWHWSLTIIGTIVRRVHSQPIGKFQTFQVITFTMYAILFHSKPRLSHLKIEHVE
jgi:hypothetical protein